jgi:aminomethyltransferase
MTKKTPLYDTHKKHHGKMIDFFGFYLPVFYEKGILHEHNQVRQAVGLFDVSHMGEFFFEGKNAKENLLKLVTVDLNQQKDYTTRYGFMCNHQGKTIDDCLVYKYSDEKYMVVVNGANIDKDKAWVLANIMNASVFTNRSDEIALLAVQGPYSTALCDRACSTLPKKYYSFIDDVTCFNKPVMISKTGYTGEVGYEIYGDPKDITMMWEQFLVHGEDLRVTPCGLGARDTLRLEAGMPLYGHELNEELSPIDASLGMFLSKNHTDYIGAEAHRAPPTTKRIGLQLKEKGIPRENYPVFVNVEQVGKVTSGTFSPSLNVGIAMALVDVDADLSQDIEIEIRKKKVAAEVVKLPFAYKNKEEKQHD